jgi:hypothetical protein
MPKNICIYDADEIAVIPLRPGDSVLDHACGAGMDLLLAADVSDPLGRA